MHTMTLIPIDYAPRPTICEAETATVLMENQTASQTQPERFHTRFHDEIAEMPPKCIKVILIRPTGLICLRRRSRKCHRGFD